MFTALSLAVIQLVLLGFPPVSATIWSDNVPKSNPGHGNGSIWALIVAGSNEDTLLNYAIQVHYFGRQERARRTPMRNSTERRPSP